MIEYIRKEITAFWIVISCIPLIVAILIFLFNYSTIQKKLNKEIIKLLWFLVVFSTLIAFLLAITVFNYSQDIFYCWCDEKTTQEIVNQPTTLLKKFKIAKFCIIKNKIQKLEKEILLEKENLKKMGKEIQ